MGNGQLEQSCVREHAESLSANQLTFRSWPYGTAKINRRSPNQLVLSERGLDGLTAVLLFLPGAFVISMVLLFAGLGSAVGPTGLPQGGPWKAAFLVAAGGSLLVASVFVFVIQFKPRWKYRRLIIDTIRLTANIEIDGQSVEAPIEAVSISLRQLARPTPRGGVRYGVIVTVGSSSFLITANRSREKAVQRAHEVTSALGIEPVSGPPLVLWRAVTLR